VQAPVSQKPSGRNCHLRKPISFVPAKAAFYRGCWVWSSSDSYDPVSRKARKMAIIMSKRQQPQPVVNNVNPLAFAMKYGEFPKPSIVPLENRQEPSELSDPGYLWNACPPRYCQYLDMEAEHQGFSSSGTTGSSEGSLSDPDFI
jgi:hypothetical protein